MANGCGLLRWERTFNRPSLCFVKNIKIKLREIECICGSFLLSRMSKSCAERIYWKGGISTVLINKQKAHFVNVIYKLMRNGDPKKKTKKYLLEFLV